MTLREGSATHAIVNHTVVEVGRGAVAGGLTCEYILAPSLQKKCIEQVLHKFVETLQKFNSRVVYHNDGNFFGSGKWILLKNSIIV